MAGALALCNVGELWREGAQESEAADLHHDLEWSSREGESFSHRPCQSITRLHSSLFDKPDDIRDEDLAPFIRELNKVIAIET